MIKKIWNKLNGSKTFIGLAVYFVLGGLLQVGAIDQATFEQYRLYAEAIVGIGLLHKVQKRL